MSDTSTQLALLLGSAVPPGFAEAGGMTVPAGSRRPGDAIAASPDSQDFQAHLRALLRGGSADETVAESLPDEAVVTLSPIATAPVVADTVRPAESLAAMVGAAPGKNLPLTGSNLPPASALTAELAEPGSMSTSQLSDESALELRQSPVSQVESKPGAKTDAQLLASLVRQQSDQPTAANSLPRESAGAQPQLLADQVTESRLATPAAASVLPQADSVGEALRRLNVQRPVVTESGRRIAPGAELKADGQSITELLSMRAEAPRVLGPTDGGAAQFTLHARPPELIATAAQPNVSSDSVLRDLQSMMPLRPQTGETPNSWSAGLGQRLLMMADKGVEVARLRLSPAHLGPLEIHVNVDDERAQVWFGAQHGATRDALEAALPRLREMFSAHGLELTHADVDDGQANQRDASPDRRPAAPADRTAAIAAAPLNSTVPPSGGVWATATSTGSLDIYV